MKKHLQVIFFLILYSFFATSQTTSNAELNQFLAKTGAKSTFSKTTKNLRFLSFSPGNEYVIAKENPAEKALYFLEQNTSLFKLKKGNDSFQVKESKKDQFGFEHVFLQQYYHGVPVFSGQLKFHFNKKVDLSSLNGNYITIDKLNPVPSISKAEAEAAAIGYVDIVDLNVAKNTNSSLPIVAKKSELLVFQKGLAEGYVGTKHLVYEVEVTNGSDIREFVFIDAHSKEKVDQFTGIHNDSPERKLYNTKYFPANPATNLVWTEGDAFPGALSIWSNLKLSLLVRCII